MSYGVFAQFYDNLTQNVDYKTKADYLCSLFEHFNHDPGCTLDLACGTGTLTIELKKRGIDVFGADMSSDMLTQAQMKLCEAGESALLICCMMQELELPEKADTCVCTLDSINHITSEKELEKAFSHICGSLSDDGLFIFDANSFYIWK